jgi:hypothetical protein
LTVSDRSSIAPHHKHKRAPLMNIWLKLLFVVPLAIIAVELAIAAVTLIAAIAHGTLTGPARGVVVHQSGARWL